MLVIGAGTSVEPPTCLPLSAACAEEAHRRLLADNVLAEPCSDPADLSLVADKVYEATGSQEELVRRLPRVEFQQAVPNHGHLLAAAMLVEGAIKDVLSLNYDLAMANALARIGGRGAVSIIQGPEHHQELGRTNLIYLHRSANSDPDQWIIRSTALDDAWDEGWEAVITNMVLASPVVVFVGLGSPAAVLTESIRRIRSALEEPNSVFYVAPSDPERSEFFVDLALPEDASVSMSWVDFMGELSQRLVEEHRNGLVVACKQVSEELGLDEEGAVALCDQLAALGLFTLGQLRAAWILDDGPYAVSNEDRNHWTADLVLAIALIERVGNCEAYFNLDGTVEFREGQRILSVVVVAHGRGRHRWSTMEETITRSESRWRNRSPKPRSALIAGVPGGRHTDTPLPIDIVGEDPPDSIVLGPSRIHLMSVDELRDDPAYVAEVLGR